MVKLGKKDTITKKYMRNPVIFADAFNKYLYRGRQMIKPEHLKELDVAEITVPYGSDGAGVPEQRYRDILKLVMTDGNFAYCILGMEGQSDIHYAMPVRNGVYDFLQLAHQVAEAAHSHRLKDKGKDKKKDDTVYKPSKEEYLSGFYKTDKLLPVITLVIFFGAEEWDAPLSLKEMYSITDEMIMQYVPDYKVNLIAPERMSEEEIEEFRSSLKEVMLYIKYSKDKEMLQKITQRDKNFQNLERQAAEVINITTNSRLKYPEGQGVVDMCMAIREMVADGEARGEARGRIEGAVEMCKEFNVSLQDTIKRIAEKFNLSLQQSEEEVRKYWK